MAKATVVAETDAVVDEAAALADIEALLAGKFTVAAGMSITSLRGVIDANEEISARDLAGGQERIDELVASGHVVKH
jgi:hypothetical protein